MNKLSHIIICVWLTVMANSGLAAAQETTESAPAEAELTEAESAELEAYYKEAEEFFATLSPQTGIVELKSAGVTLNTGDNFYFLNKKDASTVLEDAWGNPHDERVLGMIFEKDTNPYFYDYAVAVSFEKTGYVSDENASEIDFDDLLSQMQKDTRQSNPQRTKLGYPTVDLLGWAADPKYDASNNRLLWAKSLRFEGEETNTLNYNVRFLGRYGVLEFNYIADESALESVTNSMPEMSKMASFNSGHSYAEFDPTTDKVAAYGIAGLIAGGAVAKKLGILGALLLFLKKGWVLIVAGIAFGYRYIKGMFSRNSA